MPKVILDRATLARFNELKERVEFCDEAGRTLGHFQPVPSRDHGMYENLECPLTEDELRLREEEGGGRSLAEILADLEKRA